LFLKPQWSHWKEQIMIYRKKGILVSMMLVVPFFSQLVQRLSIE
jgi:hypothetical protein